MRPPKSTLVPSDRSTRTGLALAVSLIGGAAAAPVAQACPYIEISAGVDPAIGIAVYETRDENGEVTGSNCYATVEIPVSAFPSVSNRLDTNAIARAIQESASVLGATSCDVTIAYDDPNDDLSLAEECVTASFGFSPSTFWTERSEQSCWSDEDIAAIEAWERERSEREAREAAEADAFAAAEDGIEGAAEVEEWGENLDEEVAFAASEEVLISTAEIDATAVDAPGFLD